MERYDNIDIFFIAIIGAYFVTLACIVLSLIIIGIKKIIRNLKDSKELKPLLPVIEDTIKIPLADNQKVTNVKKPRKIKDKTKEKKTEDRPVKEIIPKAPHRKLKDIAIIQKLFMKEVPNSIKNAKNIVVNQSETIEEEKVELKPIKLEKAILNDKVHVNTSKYDTENTLEKQKTALENVIEQINKADNIEKQKEEKDLQEAIVSIVEEKEVTFKEEKSEEIKKENVEKIKPKTEKKSNSKTNNKSKINIVKTEPIEHEKENQETKTTKNANNKKTTTQKTTNKNSNNKNSGAKKSNNNAKKGSKSTSKKRKNSNNKKKSNNKGKKNNKKKAVKRKKS